MSLNGLDASAVAEAHQAALADPAGWFLLKYISRDTVELLSRGTGGVIEARSVIEQYDEKSPLYGLVHFRRKKVMLKYVPAGTSRLLQVRLTVQFQSVLDAFPHDTIFSFTSPLEFSESTLGLSAMLQPSAHGTSLASSAASVKHRRLDEISEDAEEPSLSFERGRVTPSASISIPVPPRLESHTPAQSIISFNDNLPPSAVKAKALLARRKEAELASNAESASTHTRGADSLTLTLKSVQSPSLDKSLPATPEQEQTPVSLYPGLQSFREQTRTPPVPPKSELRNEIPISIPLPPRSELRNEVRHISPQASPTAFVTPQHFIPATEPRPEPIISSELDLPEDYHFSHLSTKESKSISQWNDQVTAYLPPLLKPKQKRGPRPHVETPHRPKTSNTVSIPTSVRASSRQEERTPASTIRPSSQQSSKSVPGRFAPSGPVPPLPSNTQLPAMFQSAYARKPSSVASSSRSDYPNVSPEKLRLMKALQTRKRNMLLAQRAATSLSQRPSTALSGLPEERSDELDEALVSRGPSTPSVLKSNGGATTTDTRGEHDSSTASPVSATTSGAQSTMPSSVSAEGERKSSPRSSSGNTESSTTPKADQDQDGRAQAQSPVNGDVVSSIAPHGLPTVTETHEPDAPAAERVVQLTRASTPEVLELPVTQTTSPVPEQPTPIDTKQFRQSQGQTASALLNPPPRSSGMGGSLNFRRNSKRLTLNSVAGRSSANISIYSDDSLMEEIQNATLHEAKPVSVARTPATPTMRKFSSDRIREMSRAANGDSPEQGKTAPTDIEKQRSASMKSNSTVHPYVTSDEPMPPLTNKATLGSGISKRIKALEVLTHRDTAQPSPPSPKDPSAPKSGFASLMNRASFISQFQASKTNPEKNSSKQGSQPKPQAPGISQDGNVVARPGQQRSREAEDMPTPRKGETISVTARIVRDSRRPATSATTTAQEHSLNLHRSPLIVEHERHPSDPASISALSRDFSAKSFDTYNSASGEKSRISFSSHRSGSTVRQQPTEGRTSRMSFMSRRSSKAPSETSSIGEEKKATRAGRLMKRVSGIGGRFGGKGHKFAPSKDHLPQQETIVEQVEDERRQSVTESLLQMIDIGDVNVQFPETLLWKRRFMRIDDQGFLIFSPPTDNFHIRTMNRRFHLSELKAPTLPDREREEMAWSIILDLKDGSSIQCACGSGDAQQHILKMLLDAHHAYNALYTP